MIKATPSSVLHRNLFSVVILASALVLLLWTSGCASTRITPNSETDPVPRAARATLAERWGIEVTSLHLSAKGRIVDFRYRVLDSDKARLLGDRTVKPTLIDQVSGAVLHVPSFPKTGSMRQTSAKMEVGRIYFMLFANTDMPVKSGSKVTIMIGDFKATDLTVQ